jgi:hypothetical protein
MKNLILLVLIVLQTKSFAQIQAPPSNSANILFLKYSLSINGEYSFGKQLVWKLDKSDKEWKKCYGYSSTDSKGRAIDRDFYVPNENVFWYVNPAAYENVLKDNNQIRNILDGKRYPKQDDYFRAFRKIYLLDLEQANPNNPNEFKLIEVKPYLPWEH